MLYVLHGTDTIKTREKLHELVSSLLIKKPNASHILVDSDSFNETELPELLYGQGLFARKYIISFDHLFSDKNIKEIVLKNIKEIGQSENIFVILEDEIPKTFLRKVEKYATKVQLYNTHTLSRNKDSFNTFSLAEALGKRDKKNMWLLFQKAKFHNVADEAIVGILFWQVKVMLLARSSQAVGDVKLNPFVYKKALQFQKNYSVGELQRISKTLISLYHNARRGLGDLGVEMEYLILGL